MTTSRISATERLTAVLALITITANSAAAQPNITDTRLLAQPAVSATHVAFIYAGDLWTSRIDGTRRPAPHHRRRRRTEPRLLAGRQAASRSAPTTTATPTSTSSRSTGGAPKRLTWHPDADIVQGFTPDGKSVLFTMRPRRSYTNRYTQLFTVPLDGGRGDKASHPERRARVATRPTASASPTTRSRRVRRSGSTTAAARPSTIWFYDVATHAVEKIPQPKDRCNDVDAQWIGNTVYFRSDRDGEFNLFAYDAGTKKRSQRLTKHNDFPVLDTRTPAPVRSSTSRPATCTCSIRPVGQRRASWRSASPPTCARRGRAS